jgi:protein-S-isoprenylcysteine O-methyltransferase Ste14
MFVFARAATYSTVFIGLLLVFLPGRVLAWSGLARPATVGAVELVGALVALGGAAIALACILTFVVVGKGTPAPFDPPRRLVVRGPYRFVRNPMYLGAVLALCGAAIIYRSLGLVGYTVVFAVCSHVFVLVYEEPILSRQFGGAYDEYRSRVRRWVPRWQPVAGAT